MLDLAGDLADLDLLLSPGDAAAFVGRGAWRRRDGRVEASELWVVLHRRHGDWTHAYRVVRGAVQGRLLVFLERAEAGDRRAGVARWAAGALSAGGSSAGAGCPG